MMRVSTYAFFRSGELSMMQRQRDVLETQSQLASGKRINTPADDPVGAAEASGTRTALSQLSQYRSNQERANYLLNLGESTLGQVVDAGQTIKERLIAAGNGSYSNAERAAIATDLKGLLGRLVGLANSSDGGGGYLFAGSRESAPPFTASGLATTFNGDSTLLRLEVATNRLQQVKLAGDDIFLRIRAGNGTFTTTATATNAGSGFIDAGSVLDPSQLTGSSYTISFSVSGGATAYQVVRASDSAVVASGTYTAPAALRFDGQQVSIQGTPADGDSFQVAPAKYQSIFDTVAAAVQLLSTNVTNDAQRAQLQTALNGLNASIDQALDHMSLARAEYGSALSEIDGYTRLNDDRQLQYQTRLSGIEDLDLAQATSELSRRQTAFQAAIQSYSAISKLSLFNYLG